MNKKMPKGIPVKAPYEDMDAAEFLGLPNWYNELWDSLAALRDMVRDRRIAAGLTQAQLARRINSAQSVIARVENDGPGVGFDITMRALYALGASRAEVAAAIAGPSVENVSAAARARELKKAVRPQRRSAAPAKRPVSKIRAAKVAA